QFLRLLSNSPLQVDIQLLRIDARESRNTPAEHLNNFYCNFDEKQMDALEVAELLPQIAEPEAPESRIVGIFRPSGNMERVKNQ
ncbi:homoserine O-succinyltransferase, partial [Salmonella enterica subsp. enterica serovar Montevideo]|nr:homoserine O-succinyltransferase [Salmonella enterica subsp. enterica serovar Montevideo]